MNTNNTTNTQTQVTTTLVEAVTAIATQLKDLVDLAKAESTVTTTPETTTATTATEATETTTTATTPIVIIDDDDNVIATSEATTETTATTEDTTTTTEATTETTAETTEDLPCPPENVTAEDVAAEDVAETETKKINLNGLYKVIKYTMEKEGNMVRMDHSPYAPTRNMVADVGNHTIYLSLTDEEVKIIIVKKEYFNPSMTISVNNSRAFKEEVKTFYKDALSSDTKLMRFIDLAKEIISLTM